MRFLLLPLLLVPFSCAHGNDHDAPQADPWISLFDGETVAGWRGFNQASVPDGWQVVDGALTRVGPGGDLITVETFDNFILELEWRIAEHGNSGIMFRVTEDHGATYFTGAEFQVLDDVGYGEVDPLTSAGSNYALHAPVGKSLAPTGEWNQTRLVVDGAHVEHWLNGVKVVEYELWSEAWKDLVAASKFAEWPRYGMNESGHIALQEHGAEVAYRNIRIQRLPSESADEPVGYF